MDYYKSNAISQSQLTNLSYGPKYFQYKLIHKDETSALTLGSVVDCMLTEPENFDNLFIVEDYKIPTGQMKDFISYKLRGLTNEEAYKAVDFKRKKDSLEAILEVFNTEYQQFYNSFLNKEKKVISQEVKTLADTIVTSLLTNRFTRRYLKCDPNSCLQQLEIFWVYEINNTSVECRSKLDLVKIDHENKVIYPLDIKTTSSPLDQFRESIVKYRYDLQASFYTEALEYWKTHIKPEYKDYTVYRFKFIIESTKYPGFPVIYECTDHDLECGKYGGYLKNGEHLKGFHNLLDDLLWYQSNQEWEYNRSIIENNGIIKIDLFD